MTLNSYRISASIIDNKEIWIFLRNKKYYNEVRKETKGGRSV